jgi:hypothetical protein
MNHAALLVGLNVTAVEKLDYTLFCRFGPNDRAQTEGPWRLIRDGRVEVTSEDDGQKFGLPAPVDATAIVREALTGKVVAKAEIHENTGDLVLTFADGTELQLLQMSGGYESWHLYVKGQEIICTGGGSLALSKQVV